VLTWVFNTFGTADLLFAFYQGGRISLPDTQGFVRRWLFHLDCLRASASHNPWLGVPNTATSQGCRAVTEQGTYRLTQNGLWLDKSAGGTVGRHLTLSRLSMCPVLMITHVVAFYLLLRRQLKTARAFAGNAHLKNPRVRAQKHVKLKQLRLFRSVQGDARRADRHRHFANCSVSC